MRGRCRCRLREEERWLEQMMMKWEVMMLKGKNVREDIREKEGKGRG